MEPSRCSLLLFIICFSRGLSGQPTGMSSVPPCSVKLCESECILPYCFDPVPASGKVLLMAPDGTICSCQCPRFPSTLAPETRSFQALNHVDRTTRGPESQSCALAATIGLDSVLVPYAPQWSSCAIDRQLASIVEDALAIFPDHSRPIVEIRLHTDDGCMILFPNNTEGPPDWIVMPRRFLDDVNVGTELLTFMVLHELAHSLNRDWTEYQADDWAARKGLPTFYGARWTMTFGRDYLLAVIDQLRRYVTAQSPSHAVEAASGEPCPGSGCYPNLTCRSNGIMGKYVLDQGICSTDAPEGCWSPPYQDEFESEFKIDYPKKDCATRIPRCDFPCYGRTNCIIAQRLCRVDSTLRIVYDQCDRFPEICSLRKSDLKVNVKLKDRITERRLIKVERSINRVVRRLESRDLRSKQH